MFDASWWASQNLPVIEWWAAGLALVYVLLAARNSVWCWPFAFVSSVLWTWQVYFASELYFDTLLNAYYAAMAVLGMWSWWRRPGRSTSPEAGKSGAETQLPIRSMRLTEHALWIVIGLVLSALAFVLAAAYTSAALPGWDALTTVFSLIATYLLIRRRLENWIYFLIMDALYVWIYWERGSIIFSAMFVLYCVLAVYGFWSWRKIMRIEQGLMLATITQTNAP